MIKEIVCIGCPIGCKLTVQMEKNSISVSGNTCPKGKQYALDEISNPKRILTTTVKVNNGDIAMVSVKTKGGIPKHKIMECMKVIKGVTVDAPVSMGDVIIDNLLETGASLIATKNVSSVK